MLPILSQLVHFALNARPRCRLKYKYGQPATCEILLMPKLLVSGYEQLKAVLLCCIQQFSVGEAGPLPLEGGLY